MPVGVAALDHEVGDDAVELDAVVEAVAGQEDEVVDGVRRVLGEEIDDDRPARGLERRGVFVCRVDRHGRGRVILFAHHLQCRRATILVGWNTALVCRRYFNIRHSRFL